MWLFKKKKKTGMEKETLSFKELNNNQEGLVLPEGWSDWNVVPMDEKVKYLKNEFLVDSSAVAKCVIDLIEFYEEHKND